MKIYLTLIFSLIGSVLLNAQTTKVAILDFENTSGKTEYDALGKSISSMLITDLANNIHPKKVEFFERSQLNKLLDEQKLQKSKNFDEETAVAFGKLSGVNYVFVGSVFILDGMCNFSSQLVDVQTSKIILAKQVNGKIEAWLQLKSQLAEAIAIQLNNPITLDPSYKDQSTSLATINQYGKILNTMDSGNSEKAEEMRALFQETNPDFAYFKDIKEEIDRLKAQVQKNTEDIETLNKAGGRVVNATSLPEIMTNLSNPLTNYDDRKILFENVLSYKVNDITALIGSFTSACGFPSHLERLMSFDSKGKPTAKTFDLITKDLDFINSLYENNSINKETFSNYSFFYMRRLAKFLKKEAIEVQLYEGHKELLEKSFLVVNKLKNYNESNQIPLYSASTFGGESAIWLEFDNDMNISLEHLINLYSN